MTTTRTTRVLAATGVGLALLIAISAVVRAETVTLAVIVGNNRGSRPARALRYAERDAAKFRDVLVEACNVAPRDAQLLLGASSGSIWEALNAAERQVRAIRRARPGVHTVVVFYYSGHADGQELELGSTGLPFEQLVRFLRSSEADVRLAFVDSCHSGQLIASRGGRPGAPYRIRVTEEIASRGYAIITSSAEHELSQESVEIRGSFFSHYLVSALRGAADESRDGKVTLNEAYRYAYRRTVAGTTSTIGGSQHPSYDFKLAGQGDIVLSVLEGRRSAVTLRSGSGGRLLVLDAAGEAMVAEGQLAPGQSTRLVLSPGRYQLYLVRGGSVRRAPLALAEGQTVALEERQFTRARLRGTVTKGGLFRAGLGQELGAGFLLRRMFLEGGNVAMGAAVHYLVEPTPGWQAVARLSWTTAPDVGLSTGFHDVGLHGGVRYRLDLAGVVLHGGVLLGYEHLLQAARDGASRNSSAFDYLAVAGAEWPIGAFVLHASGGVGGCVFRLLGGGIAHRLDLQLVAGAAWQWGRAR